MTCKIVFQPSGTVAEIEKGTSLLHAAQQAGVDIKAYCGGTKICAKCKVKIIEGVFEGYKIQSYQKHLNFLSSDEKEFLSINEIEEKYRLACMTKVYGDIVVEIPEESREKESVILSEGKKVAFKCDPAVKSYYLELNKAAFEDNRDDLTRVKDKLVELNPRLNKEKELDIDFEVLRELPRVLRDSDWKISAIVLNDYKIIKIHGGESKEIYGLAVDVGTTTIAASLCELENGNTLQKSSMVNPQVLYGDDVISRISYCMNNPDGLETLQSKLVHGINKLIKKMVDAEGIDFNDILEMVIVFNTAMHHIALKIQPDALGVSPFISSASEPMDFRARDFGIYMSPRGNIHTLPIEAGFIGADNVAVLIAEEPYKQEEMKLIIDIGTNSEICLGNREKLYSTSCATGPALEGAQIKCGMRAALGAIEGVSIDPETLEPTIKVIGGENERPKGICGSGIIDVIAQMFHTGIIKKNGSFSKTVESDRVRIGSDKKKEYVLYHKRNEKENDIVITMKDVRAVQYAKGALYAGAKSLMQKCGLSKVDNIVLAGGFGSYINKENALLLGLFPDCKYDQITVLGNAALEGAKLALLNIEKREEAKQVAKEVEFVETATADDYYTLFSEAMFIPHKSDVFTINDKK
ncbi:ASKHA domain-containing protein [uncultured Ilyobacter sp.]|uniref:ASKHA domain-containing protein n=1 Tax=uncultured Ilyobacter sp. TaxID=544433 RepID=UPI0029BFDBB1|nr:ASKHA domain-containing protein [uncultured Ilyobacter sp.]